MESSAEPMSSCLVGFLSQSHTWLGLGLGLGPGLGLELGLGLGLASFTISREPRRWSKTASG